MLALRSPHASKTTLFAWIILEIPIVIAFLGTFMSSPPKSIIAAALVEWSNIIKRVLEFIKDPGSLKPI